MANSPPDKEPSCINCGGAGHWAIACPEPTRQVPAGLHTKRPADERHRSGGKHGAKRHKGPIVNKYSPPVPAGLHWAHPAPPPFAPPYGRYSQQDPSYPPPSYPPHGQYVGSAPPPGPPPSYSPPPHTSSRGPYNGPPHGHSHSHPGTYAGPPPGLPPAPAPYGQPAPPPPFQQPPPQTHTDWQQHQYQQPYHQPYQPHQHQNYEHHHQYPPAHPPPPPPPHYGYSAPQTNPFPQHPYAPIPPPPSRSPNNGHSFHGRPPPTHGSPGGPPYNSHAMTERGNHHSPPPPPQRVEKHGYPPSLPPPPNIGGPGSLIRILSPKSVAQFPPEARSQGRRKDRNKTWKNKRNKERKTSSATAANDQPKKRNEPKPGSETGEPPKPEKAESCEAKKPDISADTEGEKGRGKEDSDRGVDTTPGASSDKPEDGEIVDEDSDWAWDQRTIFQEPKNGHPADAVAGPLPAEYTEHVLIPPAWNANCIISVFADADNKDEFCRSVRETSLWDRYKHTVPFGSSRSTAIPPLSTARLLRLLDTRRSSQNPGRRREPKISSPNKSPKSAGDWDRAPSYGRTMSPEINDEQRDRRPVIDSYRPNYERDRPGRSTSRGRKRGRSDDVSPPPRGRGSPSSRAPYYQPHLDDRSRDSSPESDLNSLENELLGLSPKSPSGDEKEKADDKKAGESKKRQGSDVIPKSKRRRVQVDSAFSRRW